MSAPAGKQSPFPGFTKLSSLVYLRPADIPAKNNTSPLPSDGPTTILFYAWGDAHPKHVTKYIHGYLALYPYAKIAVVLGPMAKVLSQNLEQRSRGMEVAIKAVLTGDGEPERILVHGMSNTGGINYAATLNAYSNIYRGAQFPHVLSVLDSTPGSTSFFANLGPWSRAMAIGAAGWFPGPLIIMQSLAALFLLTTNLFMFLMGRPSPAVFSTRAVNDPELASKDSKRLYLYSKKDEIIHWEAVEEHAAEAKQRGYQVSLKVFLDTPHVGHMRRHPEMYWSAIREAWDEATRST